MFTPDRYLVSFHACRRAAVWTALLYLAALGTAQAQPHNDFSQANSSLMLNNTTFSTQQPKVMLGPTVTTSGQPAMGNSLSQSVGGRKIMDGQFNTSGDDFSAAGFGRTWNGDNNGQGVNGIRSIMGRNDSTYSSFNGKEVSSEFKAAYPQGPNLQLKMMPDATTRRPTMASQDQKMASLNNFTAPNQLWTKNTGPSKFADADVVQAHLFPSYENMGDQKSQMQALGQELSMQDINRYEFSGSNSSEPGLPVIKAGGNSNSSSMGSLSNGPALFDSWGSTSAPTSQVHSGAAVAPHMTAPSNGNVLMSPSQNRSSSSGTKSSADEVLHSLLDPNSAGSFGQPRDGVNTPVTLGPLTPYIPPRPGVTVDPQP